MADNKDDFDPAALLAVFRQGNFRSSSDLSGQARDKTLLDKATGWTIVMADPFAGRER